MERMENELYHYWWYLTAMLVCLLISGYASGKVRNAYANFDRGRCSSGLTGHDAAVRLLRANQLSGISVGRVGGQLSDHYHPGKNVVNLSESTYDSPSVAAVAVAAHEIGHVLQNKNGYWPYRARAAIVPAVNLGSRLAIPLVLIGILLETQAKGRAEGVPWAKRAEAAANKVSLPKGEEELFTELYRQKMNSAGDKT